MLDECQRQRENRRTGELTQRIQLESAEELGCVLWTLGFKLGVSVYILTAQVSSLRAKMHRF